MLVNTIILPFCCEAEGQIFLYKEVNYSNLLSDEF